MKLQRWYIGDGILPPEKDDTEDGEWCESDDVAALESENESLKEHLADTRRMLLWLRNHYDLFDPNLPDVENFRARVIARVDKLIPRDYSEPDYSDIPHKGIEI